MTDDKNLRVAICEFEPIRQSQIGNHKSLECFLHLHGLVSLNNITNLDVIEVLYVQAALIS